MSADGGAKKIFISHASDDPDWPEAAVRALAIRLRQRGATVLLDFLHEQEVVRRKLSLAEWRGWMRQCLDEAEHVLCLCSDRYAKRAYLDGDLQPTGRGVAFEAFEIERRLYNQKQLNRNWCWVLKLDTAASHSVVPHFLQDRCPEYGMPSEESRLIDELAGTISSVLQGAVVREVVSVPAISPWLPLVDASASRSLRREHIDRTKVFISYAHKDETWRETLRVALAPQERKQLLEVWDDRRIGTGDDWRKEIDTALKDCRIAILLVSMHFLASKFINDVELVSIFARHEKEGLWIYPILVGPCDWEGEDQLKAKQMKLCNGQPFKKASEADQEEAFAEVAKEIRERLAGTGK